MQEKVVIVTGAARGIGAATIEAFAKRGANVVLVDLKQEEVEQVAENLSLKPEKYLALEADVSKSEQVDMFVQNTMQKWGRVDVLFSNAGIPGHDKPLIEISDEEYDFCLGVCLKGCFYAFRSVLPIMDKQGGGAIIATSSLGAVRQLPLMAEYSAAKAGIIAMVRVAALEHAKHNVRINAIMPGAINTRMIKPFEMVQNITDENREEMLKGILPMGRYASPGEVAELVVFLSSDECSFITGEAIRIDGGLGI